jgi:tRNA-dihydrouridine synthase C
MTINTTPTGERLEAPRMILAPMEGVIDAVMRELLTSIGGYERCVTEFVRVSQTILPARVFLRLCPELKEGGRTPSDTPVYVQLLGSDCRLMADNAAVADDLGALGIDLNFGCPAKTVNRSEGGASLLKTPHIIRDVCRAVRDRVNPDKPVTAKIRLGFDDDRDFETLLRLLEDTGISELTIHARTRRQGYRPPAHWGKIKLAHQHLPYPVIANGELWSPADVRACLAASGAQAVMLARGALCRPDLARAVLADYGTNDAPPISWDDIRGYLLAFLDANCARYDARYAVNPVKQWLVYLKHYHPQAARLFDVAKRITDSNAMRALILEQAVAKVA